MHAEIHKVQVEVDIISDFHHNYSVYQVSKLVHCKAISQSICMLVVLLYVLLVGEPDKCFALS